MIAVLYFVDIYFTLVKAYTPSQAGIQLLYYTPGIGTGVFLAMFMCNVYPRQTFAPLFLGSIIEALGISVLAWALNEGHTPTIFGKHFLLAYDFIVFEGGQPRRHVPRAVSFIGNPKNVLAAQAPDKSV